MGLLYAAFCIFIVLFYPRQITRLICFGRNRDKVNIRSRKTYYVFYAFFTLLFMVLCLVMGSATGVDDTVDKIIYFFELKLDKRDYVEINNAQETYDYKKEYRLLYYVDCQKRGNELEKVMREMIEENDFIYAWYHLEGYRLEQESTEAYAVTIGKEVFAEVSIGSSGVFQMVTFYWDREKLESYLEEKGG